MRDCVWILLMLAGLPVFGQRVAVVMSGGAAKGIAHVGVLKALEEHEIPIDFVVGTSMGGIVAGCYAAGMSPAQIEEIMISDDLQRWVTGKPEDGYNFYYSKSDVYPSFVRLNLALDSTFSLNFNNAIANDLALNFAIAEKMAQPSAISRNNFDSLFVPLRVIASEIFTQKEVVLKSGPLGDALRATQTVPFFYQPIRVDGKYLFDGGVYNNFPVNVAMEEFKPDVVIGSNVSSKVYDEYPKNDDELISHSLLYMLLDKSDPRQVPSSGVYIQPNLRGYTGLDFSRAKELIDSGYQATMRMMPEIKKRIALRRTCDEVAALRNEFNNRSTPILVEDVKTHGFNNGQTRYINRLFNHGRRPMHFGDVKRGYYRLVSESYFKSTFPSFSFSADTRKYTFNLTRRPQHNFQVDFGGVIATRNVSNIFLGLNYYYFNRILTHVNANFFTGSFYKAAQLKARLDFPILGQFYLEPEGIVNSWNYIGTDDIIVKKGNSTILDRIDRKLGMSLGFPIGKQFKAALSGYYVNNSDQFLNRGVLVSTDTLDELRLRGGRLGIQFSTNTLDRKQYATRGKAFEFALDGFDLTEDIVPGNTSVLKSNPPLPQTRAWIRGSVILQQYFRTGIYSSGYYLHGVVSNQPVFTNYYGTIINAPGFFPIQDSRTLMLENFRAFNFVAGGWRNVFSLRKNLDFRLEGYLFKPFETIQQGSNQEAILTTEITKVYFAGTAGLVMHSTVGPVSLSLNYYDESRYQWGVLLHVGFLLFNKPSLE